MFQREDVATQIPSNCRLFSSLLQQGYSPSKASLLGQAKKQGQRQSNKEVIQLGQVKDGEASGLPRGYD